MEAKLLFLVVAALALTAPATNDSRKYDPAIKLDPGTAKDVEATFKEALQEDSPLVEEELLASLVLTRSGFLASPDSETIAKIKELIEQKMLPKITEAHNADQTQLNGLKAQLDQCETARDTSAADANIQQGLYATQSPKHKTCRTEENTKKLAKNTCDEELADKLQFKDLKCNAFAALTDNLADVSAQKAKLTKLVGESDDAYITRIHGTQCSEGHYQAYVDAKEACNTAKQTWTDKTAECTQKGQEYTTKKQACDNLQETMDNAACSHAEKVKAACTTYTECHTNKKQAYDAAETTVKENAPKRRIEWRATKRMQCLIKAFEDGDVKESEVQACKDKTHDTSDLEINYPTAAGIEDCQVPNLYPTTPAYRAAEFDGLPEFAKGDPTANECVGMQSCVQITSAGSSASLDTAFWASECAKIPVDAMYVKITMGQVTDYFKPNNGKTFCQMLGSYTQHQWSKDGVTWITPDYYGGHLGGSKVDWPKDNVAGDSRKYLTFWGGHSGGCCHNSYSDGAAWNRAFTAEYCVEAAPPAPAQAVRGTCQEYRGAGETESKVYSFTDGTSHECDMVTDGGGWTLIARVNKDFDWVCPDKGGASCSGSSTAASSGNLWDTTHQRASIGLAPQSGAESGISTDPSKVRAYKGAGDWDLRFSFYDEENGVSPRQDGKVSFTSGQGTNMFNDNFSPQSSLVKDSDYSFTVLTGEASNFNGKRLCWTSTDSRGGNYEGGLFFGTGGSCHLDNNQDEVMMKSHYARLGSWYSGQHGLLNSGRLQVASNKIAVWIRAKALSFPILSNDHSAGAVGQYFNLKAAALLGGSGQTKNLTVKQCRNGAQVWEGAVVIWTSNNGGSGDVDSHGRRDAGASSGQWLVGDVITTGASCPQAR